MSEDVATDVASPLTRIRCTCPLIYNPVQLMRRLDAEYDAAHLMPLEVERSQPLEVDLEVCLLHRQLNQVSSLFSQTFAAVGGRSRRARLRGVDVLRAVEAPHPEDVLR